jgi:hypothetical protein
MGMFYKCIISSGLGVKLATKYVLGPSNNCLTLSDLKMFFLFRFFFWYFLLGLSNVTKNITSDHQFKSK